MSQIFLQTRGKSIDYRFLVKSPSESWWRKYRKLTIFENPTLIIERTPAHRRIYLSAIPSKRKDRVQTTIRYTLVVELDSNDNYLNFLDLVLIWLEEVKQWRKKVKEAPENLPPKSKILPKSKIGDLLDNYFPKDRLEELLGEKQLNGEVSNELDDELKKFINDISQLKSSNTEKEDTSKTEKEDTSKYKIWWGGIDNQNSFNTWISLVSKLLRKEEHGKALFLNLAVENDLKQLYQIDENNRNVGLLIIENDQEPQKLPIRDRQSNTQFSKNSFSLLRLKCIALLIFIGGLLGFLSWAFFLK